MPLSLSEVTAHTELSYLEAIAVAQQLLQQDATTSALGTEEPSLDTVGLEPDGHVLWSGNATISVGAIGRLLCALLPADGTLRVPGSLRYAIARAMRDVDAPPFESTAALSSSLARHEQDDRVVVVQKLFARAAAAAATPLGTGRSVERRLRGASAAALRHELRKADEAPFDLPLNPVVAVPIAGDTFPARRWIVSGVLAASIAFAAGYAAVPLARRAHLETGAPPTTREPARPAAPTVQRPGEGPAPIHAPDARPVSLEPARDMALTHLVPRATGTTFSPSFASNGTAIFFHTGETSDPHSALAAADLRGDDLRVMTILDDGKKNYHVRPSPDGSRIAFDSDRDGERGVYVASRDGTGARRVSGPGFAALPAWSPDGRTLAFVRAEPDRPKVWNVWLVNLNTSQTQRLSSYRYGQTWSASWFPDGRRICYSHEDRLIIRDVKSGATREIASPVPNRLVRTPAVSPNGQSVIFQVSGSGAWLLDLDTSAMRFVLTDPSAEEFAWAPDGRRVAFHSRRNGQWGLWVMAPVASDVRG